VYSVLPVFSPDQLTSTIPVKKIETSCKSHPFEQKNSNQYVKHGAEGFLSAPLPEILSSLARFGAPLLSFENSTFFVRSQHTKKSHPAGLIRKRCETRIPWPTSGPIPPGLKPEFLFSETDG
jgi:hypothetical protein